MINQSFAAIARRTFLLVAIGILAGRANAKWMAPTQMPVARLLKSTAEYVKAHPKDAPGYYMLGRINSAAFALNSETIAVYPNDPLPRFPAYEASPVQARPATPPLSNASLNYYSDALRNYRQAVKLDPTSAIGFLGVAFECEEGLRFPQTSDEARKILGLSGGRNTEKLRAEALRSYRRAYALAIPGDRKLTSGGFSPPISQEAAEGIVRLQKGKRLNPKDQTEVSQLQATIEKLARLPRPITPILVSFNRKSHLSELLSPGARVHFDLSGEGTARAWPWVKLDTGILVWDPEHTGKITSGLQLFGSVTWWLFWKDGYAPLTALDDDHNGWLEGREMQGIAVWFDRNGNGVSDPGEVVSLDSLGVLRISVRAAGQNEGVAWNPAGVELKDGNLAATYDWTPMSCPSE